MLSLVSSVYTDKSVTLPGLGVTSCSGLADTYKECLAEVFGDRKRTDTCADLHELSRVP